MAANLPRYFRNSFKNDPLFSLFLVFIFAAPIMITPDLPLLRQRCQLSELIFIFLFVLLAAQIIKNRKWPFQPSIAVIVLINLAFMFLSLLRMDRDAWLAGAFEIAVQAYLFLVFFVAAYIVQTRKQIAPIFSAWGWSLVMVLVFGLVGLLLYAAGLHQNPFIGMGGLEYNFPATDWPRVTSTFRHGTYLANFMAPSFFFLAYLRDHEHKWLGKASWFRVWTLLFVAVGIFTISRSFLIWLAVLIPWLVFITRKDRLTRILAMATSIAILVFVALITIWVIFPLNFHLDHNRKQLTVTLSTRPSPRMEMWTQAAAVIKKSPVWGRNLVEATGPAWVAGRYFPKGVEAHNTFLQLWATRGIFGLLSYLAFIALAVKAGLRRPLKPEHKFLVPAIVSLFIIFFLDHMIHPRFTYLLLGLFAGMGNRPTDADP